MEHIVKFGTSAVTTFPIASYFFSNKDIVTDMFGTVSLPIAISVLSGVSYLVSDLVHDQLFPALHISEKFSAPASSAMNIGVNYGATYGMLELAARGSASEIPMSNLLLTSAGSAVASHYVYNNFVAPWYGYSHASY